jgi:hypothetical protein
MQQHKVKFTIKPGGGISFEVLDGQGQSCVEVTKDIELHLSRAGNKVDEGKKPEYYEAGPDINVFNDLN